MTKPRDKHAFVHGWPAQHDGLVAWASGLADYLGAPRTQAAGTHDEPLLDVAARLGAVRASLAAGCPAPVETLGLLDAVMGVIAAADQLDDVLDDVLSHQSVEPPSVD